jgi:hypothetical protein
MGSNPTVLTSGPWISDFAGADFGPDGLQRSNQAGLKCAIGVGWLPICRGPTFLYGGIIDGEARRYGVFTL